MKMTDRNINFLNNIETKRQRLRSRRLTRKSIFAGLYEDLDDVATVDPLQKRLEEVFNLFDSGNKGEIDTRELGTVVRALGCVITEAELQQMQKELEDVEYNCIPRDRFIEFMRKAIGEQKYKPVEADTLLQAFKLFDPENRGYVMREDIEKAIVEYGEPFTPEELHDMMTIACDPKTQRINYEHYLNLLIEKISNEKNLYELSALSAFLAKLQKSKSITSEE